MKSEKSKIQEIVIAHIALVSEYDKILKSTNGGSFFIKGNFKCVDLRNLFHFTTRRNTSYFDKMILIIFQFWVVFDIELLYDYMFSLFLFFIRKLRKHPSELVIISIRPIIRS